jgi:transmembrane sensor
MPDLDDAVLEEASARFLRLRNAIAEGKNGLPLEEELQRWLSEDARHDEAYRIIEQGWAATQAHAAAPEIVVARSRALEAARYAAFGRWSRKILTPARLATVAILLLCGSIPVIHWVLKDGGVIYETEIGETRAVTLPDNSRLTLDGQTRVLVSYSDNFRDIRLLQGQAQFEVSKNPARPFRVTAGEKIIVAHGTVFDVELVEGQLLVTLLEGRVSIAGSNAPVNPAQGRELTPGQQIVVKRNGTEELHRDVNLEMATSWRDGKLVFKDQPLEDVVARLNRHSRLQIRIDDPRISSMLISGVYTGDTGAFIDAVEQYFAIRVVYTRNNVLHLGSLN